MLLVTKHLPPGSALSASSQGRQIKELSSGQLAVLAELSSLVVSWYVLVPMYLCLAECHH